MARQQREPAKILGIEPVLKTSIDKQRFIEELKKKAQIPVGDGLPDLVNQIEKPNKAQPLAPAFFFDRVWSLFLKIKNWISAWFEPSRIVVDLRPRIDEQLLRSYVARGVYTPQRAQRAYQRTHNVKLDFSLSSCATPNNQASQYVLVDQQDKMPSSPAANTRSKSKRF